MFSSSSPLSITATHLPISPSLFLALVYCVATLGVHGLGLFGKRSEFAYSFDCVRESSGGVRAVHILRHVGISLFSFIL